MTERKPSDEVNPMNPMDKVVFTKLLREWGRKRGIAADDDRTIPEIFSEEDLQQLMARMRKMSLDEKIGMVLDEMPPAERQKLFEKLKAEFMGGVEWPPKKTA